MAKVLIVILFIYTKISFRVKHIFNMFIFLTIILLFIFFITKEIILITASEI